MGSHHINNRDHSPVISHLPCTIYNPYIWLKKAARTSARTKGMRIIDRLPLLLHTLIPNARGVFHRNFVEHIFHYCWVVQLATRPKQNFPQTYTCTYLLCMIIAIMMLHCIDHAWTTSLWPPPPILQLFKYHQDIIMIIRFCTSLSSTWISHRSTACFISVKPTPIFLEMASAQPLSTRHLCTYLIA